MACMDEAERSDLPKINPWVLGQNGHLDSGLLLPSPTLEPVHHMGSLLELMAVNLVN